MKDLTPNAMPFFTCSTMLSKVCRDWPGMDGIRTTITILMNKNGLHQIRGRQEVFADHRPDAGGLAVPPRPLHRAHPGVSLIIRVDGGVGALRRLVGGRGRVLGSCAQLGRARGADGATKAEALLSARATVTDLIVAALLMSWLELTEYQHGRQDQGCITISSDPAL